ncbi:DUF2188 domain-containing protein [Paenibacillus senegalensis]|uniref:DUF2188 domain-containing protein n=1 Tax=Paenibacillus senegalensis TaxID=1465766 RepID=UPI0002889959|nr:DUF2188 domain-containing protein [Paenibacillus senegalensis]
MPWTKNDYPDSMKNLEERTRNKAIEIANSLLEEQYEEGRAISIAIAQAKKWEEDHPQTKDSTDHVHLHVVPEDGHWLVKKEGSSRVEARTSTKEEAVKKAKELASRRNVSAFIHRQDGTVEKVHNYA